MSAQESVPLLERLLWDPAQDIVADDPSSEVQHAGLNSKFWSALWHLVKLLKPYSAPLLCFLAVLEVLLGAQVGKITGQYYRILLDKEWHLFWKVTGLSALIYLASIVVKSTQIWYSELLSVRWRKNLSMTLQTSYLRQKNFCMVEAACDNPDQRMIQDASQFCSSLAMLSYRLAATPFKIVYYGAWVWSIASWVPIVATLAFFLAGSFAQKLLTDIVASIVCKQEALEGNLRYAHMRIRTFREQIAMWSGQGRELENLHRKLLQAVENQTKLVYWRWALSACTIFFDYAGAILNFTCVALPIALGVFGEAEGSGELAQRISNASFATLSLIYSLTEILDLSNLFATLAGLTARVKTLVESLEVCLGTGTIHGWETSKQIGDAHQSTNELGIMQSSVHRLGRHLCSRAELCFPDLPVHEKLYAVLTLQTKGFFSTLTAASMDAYLQKFLHIQNVVRGHCQSESYWCNAVDPRTGFALHGMTAERWSDVRAAHLLLGYDVNDASACPQIQHPSFGKGVYLGTILTTAPLETLQVAMHEAGLNEAYLAQFLANGSGNNTTFGDSHMKIVNQSSRPADHGKAIQRPQDRTRRKGLVLNIEELTIISGDNQPLLDQFNLRMLTEETVIIEGDTGVGKTTLLRAICGLWPCTASWISMTNKVVFLSQLPLAAPGLSLRDQLIYPGSQCFSDSDMHQALKLTQLEHLLSRVRGNFDAHNHWHGQLSVGEMQRLACARLILTKPKLAFMDEPFSALGTSLAINLLEVLKNLGTALVVTSQPVSPLSAHFDRKIKLNKGGSWTTLQ